MLIDIELDDVEFYSNVEQVGRSKYANVCRNKITSKHLLINMMSRYQSSWIQKNI